MNSAMSSIHTQFDWWETESKTKATHVLHVNMRYIYSKLIVIDY